MAKILRVAGLALAVLTIGVSGGSRPADAQVLRGLIVAVDDVVDPVLMPASEVEYAVEVLNPTAAPIANVLITADTPAGTYFGEASTTVGTISAPAQGSPGKMAVEVGTLAPGASARVRFELGLTASAGTRLDFSATVTSGEGETFDLSEPTFVENRGAAVLVWEARTRDASGSSLPRMLRVERPESPFNIRQNLFPLDPVPPGVEYRVYRSVVADVEPTEANLFATLPGTQMSTAALAEPGFYVVTAVVDGVESAPSNVTSFGVGEPVVEKLTIKNGVIKAQGSNFDATVEVTVDGLRFAQPAVVKREGTRVAQSGKLENGLSLKKYLKQHFTSLVEFRNANGAVTSVRYENLTFQN